MTGYIADAETIRDAQSLGYRGGPSVMELARLILAADHDDHDAAGALEFEASMAHDYIFNTN